MDLADDDQLFLLALVKSSRQRPHAVAWVDRDGTARQTTLTPADAARLNALAHRLGVSKGETLRQAAHIPMASQPPPPRKVPEQP
jgi:hypothetical protein